MVGVGLPRVSSSPLVVWEQYESSIDWPGTCSPACSLGVGVGVLRQP